MWRQIGGRQVSRNLPGKHPSAETRALDDIKNADDGGRVADTGERCRRRHGRGQTQHCEIVRQKLCPAAGWPIRDHARGMAVEPGFDRQQGLCVSCQKIPIAGLAGQVEARENLIDFGMGGGRSGAQPGADGQHQVSEAQGRGRRWTSIYPIF